MERITIKLSDGEVTVPEIFGILDGDGRISSIYKVLPEDTYSDGETHIRYLFPPKFANELCKATDFGKDFFQDLVEITPEGWNSIVRSMSKRLTRNLIIK